MQISFKRVCAIGICLFLLTLALPVMAQNRIIQGKITTEAAQKIIIEAT